MSGPWSSWAPVPALCRHWVGGLGQEATGCGMPGVLRLVLAHWCRQTHVQGWVVMGLGFAALVLACWLLESVLHSIGCGFHGVQSWCWPTGEWGWTPGWLSDGLKVSQSRCGPGGGWGWDLVGCAGTAALLLAGAGPHLASCLA